MSPSEKKPTATRLATAVPGALSAVLLIGAVAFGATSLRPAAEDPAAGNQADEPAKAASAAKPTTPQTDVAVADRKELTPDATPHPRKAEAPKAEPMPKPEPKPEAAEAPTDEPKPVPVETRKPVPTVKPAPVDPTALVLEAWAKDTKAKLAWTPFVGDGFEYYKVVRSADANVTWPASGDDEVVGVIGDPNAPWHVDEPACEIAWNYAVFAVRHGDTGYVTLAASNVAAVSVACAAAPAPIEVKPLAFQVEEQGPQRDQRAGHFGHTGHDVLLSHPRARCGRPGPGRLIGGIGDCGADAGARSAGGQQPRGGEDEVRVGHVRRQLGLLHLVQAGLLRDQSGAVVPRRRCCLGRDR